jgi:serine/threonine protein kinase/tetratricopeptide (TPR) repeat protein
MPPSVGMCFGRYELLSRLGAGGMGEVFRARDHDLQRDVAVKFLPERFASDPARLGRFAQEARAASSLNHPNIVTIHEIGETAGLPYIVMELVEGQTLREMVTDRPLPTRRVLEIAGQLADGLAKAHAAGIVHRDLKPENVMVTGDGYVKILDFGLAKLLTSDSGDREVWFDSTYPTWPESPGSPQTAEGAVLGTVGYMSPEQARARAVDFRADQFAFGAILYEMATGQQAFRRETPAQTLTAIIEIPAPPVAALNPSFPPPAAWIVERCLEKDPSRRYASTLDLARELRTLREHLTDGSGSSSPSRDDRRAAPARPRRRRQVGVLLAAVAALSGAAVLSPGLRDRLAVTLRLRPVPREKGIAVLPFRTTSPDPADRYRADGLTETLAARLSQLQRFHEPLWVVPASEVRQSGVTSAADARRAFGVTLVVTGHLQRLGDRLRLTARLVDALDLRQLRALGPSEYETDDLSLQDQLVQGVARMLELTLAPAEQQTLRSGGTSVGAAYSLYLEARGYLQRYDQAESLEHAASLLQQALQRDPEYALAYAGLAEAEWQLYRLTRDRERVVLAKKACERALKLNDLLAPVHVTLGIIHAGTGEAQRALTDFDRALALDPADADALREKARAYEALGRASEAEETFKKAVSLRPGYWGNHSQLGAFYFRQARYADAEQAFREALRLTPDNVRVLASLGGVLQTVGRDDEAVAVLQRSLALRPTYRAASNLGALEFERGRYAESARAFERALALDDSDFRVWRNLAAAYHWAPGQAQKARPAWRKAEQLAEEAARVNPKDAAVLAELASCRAMLGETALARKDLARAVDLAPDDVEIEQLAASVYEQMGDRNAALVWIRRALAAGYPRAQVERDPFLTALRADPRFPGPGSSGGAPGAASPTSEKPTR